MKNFQSITLFLTVCLLVPLITAAQSSTVKTARSAPGPDPDLFDGSQAEFEGRPESGIISDFEQGSGESAKQQSQEQQQQQQQQQGSQQQGGGGQGTGGEQQDGGGGGSSEMLEEGQQEAQDFGQQGQQGGQQNGQQGGQQGRQQGQQSSSSSSSQQSGQQKPTDSVKLGDESLKIETVDLPPDEDLIGQQDDGKPEAKDSGAGGAAGSQSQQRRNTGVEEGDAMPSDI